MYKNITRIAWVIFFLAIIGLPLLISSIRYNWFGLYGGMPDLSDLDNPKNELASEVFSADGELLGKYFRENRSSVEYDNLSPNLINALTATEDIRFEEHSGVDLIGLLRVFYGIVSFDLQGGGSTISQQLAKNLFQTRGALNDGTLCRMPLVGTFIIKVKEMILAVNIEKYYTKKEVMTLYLNTVDFGSNAFGIKVASKTFFNVEPDSLSVPQAAILVGLLKAPTAYSPRLNPENSIRRRNTVFGQMKKYDFLTQEELDSLKELPIGLEEYSVASHNKGLATYFRAELAKELRTWCKNNTKADGSNYDLYADGLRVYTTIDTRMQKLAEEAIEEHMTKQQGLFFEHWKGRNPWITDDYKEIKGFLNRVIRRTPRYASLKKQFGDQKDSIDAVLNRPVKMRVFTWDTPSHEMDTVLSPIDSVSYYKHFLQAGMIAVDPFTGHIKAWVGGIEHKYFQFDHVKQGYRQPGSTFKPILYSYAIDKHKYHPCFKVVDAPITFTLPSGDVWTPKNSSEYSGATFTLRQAMAMSKNTIAAYLMKEFGDHGPELVANYAEDKFGIGYLRQKYGINRKLERVPSLCLGTSDVSLFEMAAAYTPFVNGGIWTEPLFITRIEDKEGKVLAAFTPKTIQTFGEDVAYTMSYMLRGSNEERGGTSVGLRVRQVKEGQQGYNFIRGNQVGGKTGTTSNYSDAWFMGITKDLVVGVWSGGDDTSIHFRSLKYGQGGRQAMPAYALFMEKLFEDEELGFEKGEFPKPVTPIGELDCWKYEVHESSTDSTGNFILPGRVDENEFN
ncbi:transglycosylase domain-containing protein [Flammeovirgaceae bacterium SG7u.111]|nr:transglycosylase domain-containing protein [Flammeovirgaceae bacterium SG7u.132]WPO34282.1 transglycosylase domain-containing protein [Flammeovirgaceae bacterium SG7u.111]